MTTQSPTVYAYKSWFGRWKFKFLANGLPRADKPITLLYHKPMDYDALAISNDAWQKVAKETMVQLKELQERHGSQAANLEHAMQMLQSNLDTYYQTMSDEEMADMRLFLKVMEHEKTA